MKSLLYYPAVFFLLCSLQAQAFPENVRRGYFNCVTCHTSPSGGGLLTKYGQALALEEFTAGRFFFESQKTTERDAEAAEDQAADSVVFQWGFSARVLQLFRDTQTAWSGRFIPMQLDFEAAVTAKRWQVLGTIGRHETNQKNPTFWDYVINRRYWASLRLGPEANPDLFRLRLGRFYRSYGVNIPEHNYLVRRSLGFDQSQETLNLEATYLSEEWNAFLTGVIGRPGKAFATSPQGLSIQVTRMVAETRRVGVNYETEQFRGRPESERLHRFGVLGVGSISRNTYVLTELDGVFQRSRPWTLVAWSKFGFEFSKGWHLIVMGELQRAIPLGRTTHESLAVGLNYYPKPSWEFDVQANWQRISQTGTERALTLMAHYYL